ncbi:MAG: EAL domain-containing protein [Alsobacter sp.]
MPSTPPLPSPWTALRQRFQALRSGTLAWTVLAAGLGLAATIGTIEWLGVGDTLDRSLYDARFLAQSRSPSGRVVVVDIDERSISAIGVWPWPRSIHARMIDRLREARASATAFDVEFSSASSDAEDAALEAALRRAGGSVILAAIGQSPTSAARDRTPVLVEPHPRFERQSWSALVNVTPDPDTKVRWVPYALDLGGKRIPSLSATLAGSAPPPAGIVQIDFTIDPHEIRRLSAIDLIEGRFDPAELKDKKVIIGASTATLKDIFAVPRYGAVPGSIVHALAVETLIKNRSIVPAPRWVEAAGLVVLGLLGALAVVSLPLAWGQLALAGAAVAVEGVATVVQSSSAVSMDTSSWHVLLASLMIGAVGGELARRRMLWLAARSEERQTQAILDRVFADSVNGVVVVDEGQRIRAASSAVPDLLDLAPGPIAGRQAAEVLPPPFLDVLRTFAHAAPGERQRSGLVVLERPGGEARSFEYTLSLSVSAEAGPGLAWQATCLTFSDITERLRDQQRIAFLARFDSVTGLPNRHQFVERIGQEATLAGCTLLLFDIDRFKRTNELLGQTGGDDVLRQVARRVVSAVGDRGFVARLDGDGFAVFRHGDPDDMVQPLTGAFDEAFEAHGLRALLTISVGVAQGAPGVDADELTRRAELALQSAKEAGGSAVRSYSESLDLIRQAEEVLLRELEQALARGEFRIVYQLQKDCRSGEVTGVEALIRWQHPARGLLPPSAFIGVLETSGLISRVGEWALAQACRDAMGWPGHVRVAVNAAVPQFVGGEFAGMVARTLAQTGLPASRLDIELTESLFAQDDGAILQELQAVRAMGVGLALDDFGTGYSSLGYIRRFPFTKVKLDQTFIRDLPHVPTSSAIVQAVVAIARAIDLKVVAEGVETEAQFQGARLLGCDEAQGYLISRPEPAAVIGRLLGSEPVRLARPA